MIDPPPTLVAISPAFAVMAAIPVSGSTIVDHIVLVVAGGSDTIGTCARPVPDAIGAGQRWSSIPTAHGKGGHC